MTSNIQPNPNPANTGGNPASKVSRRPNLKPEAGTSWFTVKPTGDTYGPCSLEINIETIGVLGQEEQPGHIKAFCDGFGDLAATCIVTGYGVKSGVWTVSMDLASEKAGATKELVNSVSAALTPYFQTSQILQRQHGFGKAKCRVLEGAVTRFTSNRNNTARRRNFSAVFCRSTSGSYDRISVAKVPAQLRHSM